MRIFALTGVLLLVLTGCAIPGRSSGRSPFEVQFNACEAKLPKPPAEQRITVMIDGRPELQKAIFLNDTYYQEIPRCIHGGEDAGKPLPIVDGRLKMPGFSYAIDIGGSAEVVGSMKFPITPKVEQINGRVYRPMSLSGYAKTSFDEATQTLSLQNRPEKIPSPTNLPHDLKYVMAGEWTGLRGGFSREKAVWAFGKQGLQFRELPQNDFLPHIELVTEGGTELLVAPRKPFQLAWGFWLHLPDQSRPLLVGRTGEEFHGTFPTPEEAFDRHRKDLGITAKLAEPIGIDADRAKGAFDLAGHRFYIHFRHYDQTSKSRNAGWIIEGITWGEDCQRFEYCPQAWR